MTTQGFYVFRHDSELGKAPAHKLFELIRPKPRAGIISPRSFSDYEVGAEEQAVPPGVTLLRMA